MQMVFQDPYGSLDPRQRVETIVAEPLAALGGVTGAERRARVRASLEAVGLTSSDALKHPHEFSGGQRQRIAIARALITRPRLVVADEPVSALDVSVQAQTLNLMSDLEREAGVTFLLISHDLAVVAHICETTAVLYRGRIVEIGQTDAMFAHPAHPYTRELVDATPRLDGPTRAPLAPLAPAPVDQNPSEWSRHRQERSDAAIQAGVGRAETLDCFASLAMTSLVRAGRGICPMGETTRQRVAPMPRAAHSDGRAAARRRRCLRRRTVETARWRATIRSIRSAALTLM